MPGWYAWQQHTLVLQLVVQTRASRDEICGVQDGRLKNRISAPPVEGKANAHLIAFLAKHFGISKSALKLVAGETSRRKRLHVALKKPDLPVVLARFANPVEESGQN